MNMIEKRKAMAGQGGFTLIELLVVIAILAVLAGAAIVGIGAMRTNAKKTACKSERDTVSTALEAVDVDTGTAGNTGGIQSAKDLGYLKKVTVGDWSASYSVADKEWVVDPVQGTGHKFGDVAVADCQ